MKPPTSGGPIPGSRPGSAAPILAYAGEYVLPADVVERIKAGAPLPDVFGPDTETGRSA